MKSKVVSEQLKNDSEMGLAAIKKNGDDLKYARLFQKGGFFNWSLLDTSSIKILAFASWLSSNPSSFVLPKSFPCSNRALLRKGSKASVSQIKLGQLGCCQIHFINHLTC